MSTTDTFNNPWLRISDAKDRMTIWLDAGFTCAEAGPVTVHGNGEDAYFLCSDGQHDLISQCDDGEHCIGVYPQKPTIP